MLSEVTNKITISIPDEKKNIIINKVEDCVKCCLNQVDFEINFEDKYPLYFGGKEIEKGAFVNIEVYNRRQNREKYVELKTKIKNVYIKELEIPEERIFIQFDDYEN